MDNKSKQEESSHPSIVSALRDYDEEHEQKMRAEFARRVKHTREGHSGDPSAGR